MKNIVLLIIITALSPLRLLAVEDTDQPKHFEIENISYDYELFEDKTGKYDCNGNLNIKISIDETIEYLTFTRSIQHLTEMPKTHWVAVKSNIEFQDYTNSIEWTRSNTSWGTYFMITAHLKNDSWENSPIYFTSDYISAEDMTKFQNNSGIEDITTECSINISFINWVLRIDTTEIITLSVYDLTGRTLFNGSVSEYSEIPLHANLIIVKYTTKDQTVTQKFISK